MSHDTRLKSDRLRRLTRRARRLPLRAAGLVLLGLAAAMSLIAGPSTATALVFAALAALLADRFVWRHTRTADLRRRYRALGNRAELLDDRLHALRESEAVHRTLTETFGDVAVQVAGGRIAFANAPFRALFPDAESVPVPFEGDDAEGETAFDTALGLRVLRWRALPALDARGRPALRWIARDVTDAVAAREAAERAADEAAERAAAKGRFLAIAAHEIRNPLTGIFGMAQLLQLGALDAHARSQVTAITRSARALQAVLDDILDETRMEADRLRVEHEPFDIGALVEGVAELSAPQAHEKGLDIAVHTVRHGEEAVPRVVEGDANRVRQIVANLVSNALKFTTEGGVSVVARVEDGLRIEVRDTGPGLTADEAVRIFDAFASGGDDETAERLARRLGGVGLGLTISRRLAEAMGGSLDVVSRPGEGSLFTLRLPLAAAERPQTTELAGQQVCLVTASRVLIEPLRRFVEVRGGRLVTLSPEALARRGGWDNGPLLVDERVDVDVPDYAVRLVRDGAAVAEGRWLRLPWRAASLERALTGQLEVERPQPNVLREAVDTGGPGRRVLVAEDDPVTQLLATAVLERAGHRVTLAATGHDAARLYREAVEGDEPFAAVLLDVNLTVSGDEGTDGMAALRGFRAIERARDAEPAAIHVVTGDAREVTGTAAMAAGATSVLVKPVAVDVLAALVPQEEGPREDVQTSRSPAMR